VSSIVVYVDPSKDGCACSVRATFNVPNPRWVEVVDLKDVTIKNGPTGVRELGEQLAAKLCQNTTIKSVLDKALAHPKAPPSVPIYFSVGDATAHALPWEALVGELVGKKVFVALDDRWPIARIPRTGELAVGAKFPFAPPLKFACVLSAVGVSAKDEWAGIYAAVEAARTNGFAVHVTVFAGEDAIIQTIQALNDPHTVVAPVPGRATDLLRELDKIEPHILHFFCHGAITGAGIRRLEIGTVGDFQQLNPTTSSVLLLIDELGTSIARGQTWAVVLNTCASAQAAGDAMTHAEDLVSRGVPVAIGMRRLFNAPDALLFSSSLYPALFKTIQAASAAPGTHTVGWMDALLDVRTTLRDAHGSDPDQFDEWTIPVLYTRPGPFELIATPNVTPAPTTRALGEKDALSKMLNVVSGAPPTLLKDLQDLLPPEGNA